jgi:spore maturation protein SpmA
LLNWIWAFLLLGAVATGAVNDARGGFVCEPLDAAGLAAAGLTAPRTCMKLVTDGAFSGANDAIQLLIKMIGGMILFLGLVRVANEAGLLRVIVRVLRPLLRRFFPEIPEDHPAMGAIVMNLSANMLGLGNAATPFGVKAMIELDRLNTHPGVATNAMALFLAINSASIVLMPPTGTATLRHSLGSQAPLEMWLPTIIATSLSLVVAVAATLVFQRLGRFAFRAIDGGAGARTAIDLSATEAVEAQLAAEPQPASPWALGFLALCGTSIGVGFAWAAAMQPDRAALGEFVRDAASTWLLPILIFALVGYGVARGVKVYEVAIEGGKEALDVAKRIAPYLVMILAAIQMFRASGALEIIIGGLRPVTSALGVPPEVLPMMLLRPLSGSGAYAVMADTLKTHGPDSGIGLLVSALQGSTETTFYVLAVYLGAVGVRNSRHILPACLLGDLAGYVGAVAATRLLYPHLFAALV